MIGVTGPKTSSARIVGCLDVEHRLVPVRGAAVAERRAPWPTVVTVFAAAAPWVGAADSSRPGDRPAR